MSSPGSRAAWGESVVFASIVLIVAGSVAGMAVARAGSGAAGSLTATSSTSTTTSFNLTGLVIPALSNSTAWRIAETSPQFMSLTQGKNVTYTGAAGSLIGNTVMSIDANFLVTDTNGGKEVIIVSMAVGPGNVPNGDVIGVKVLPYLGNY